MEKFCRRMPLPFLCGRTVITDVCFFLFFSFFWDLSWACLWKSVRWPSIWGVCSKRMLTTMMAITMMILMMKGDDAGWKNKAWFCTVLHGLLFFDACSFLENKSLIFYCGGCGAWSIWAEGGTVTPPACTKASFGLKILTDWNILSDLSRIF